MNDMDLTYGFVSCRVVDVSNERNDRRPGQVEQHCIVLSWPDRWVFDLLKEQRPGIEDGGCCV